MKTYNSSDLTHKRAKVLKEARENGVLIQEKRTNGEIIQEYVLIGRGNLTDIHLGDDSGREVLTVIKK